MSASASVTSTQIKDAHRLGQSIWFDNIRRALLTSGELGRMVREDGLRGVTSNPSIFEKAISGSSDYDDAFAQARVTSALDAKSVYETLAIKDIRDAADVLAPVYESSGARDGYVSMEVSPALAHDTAGTFAEAQRLWAAVDRPNLMVKVPATEEGIPAIQQLIAGAVNVNVTLLFSAAVYERVVEAYIAGLEDRLSAGGEIGRIASVASFFVSRIDSAVDALVGPKLQGKVAIANAKVTYARSKELFDGPGWEALARHGAQLQRLLWASTSTKNPAYDELLYVESLIGPDTVDTVPPGTYEAFKARGTVRPALTEDLDGARAVLDELASHGVDLEQVTDRLLSEGVEKFDQAFRKLLAAVEKSIAGARASGESTFSRSLPADLDGLVDAIVDEWREGGKVARLWARDPTLWTGSDEAQWLGWLLVAMDQLTHCEPLVSLAEQVRQEGFQHAVVLGMGGSSLCPEVLALTYPPKPGQARLAVLDSTDPQQVKALEDQLDLSRTLFLVSSKSGTTLEPNSFASYFHDRVASVVGAEEAGSRFIAITDPGSALEQTARSEGYRAVYHGVKSIGGRYSALSNFGMIPGAAAGVDVLELLERAERMAHACAAAVPAAENPGLLLGAVIGACATSGRDKLTLIASPGIYDFGAWLEQLLAESTGKEGKGVVPVDREPLGEPGVYGEDRLFVYLRLQSGPDAGQDAAVAALEQAGQPVVRITLADSYDLGGEFFRWEFATAVAGSIIAINPFNQPDVEDAKVATRELTEAYERARSLPDLTPFFTGDGVALIADQRNARELTRLAGEAGSLDAYLRAHLGRVGPGDYVALLAYVPMNAEHEELLTRARTVIRDHLHVATCVGFGPRFQHSTGQAYKGGPNTGVFLQITCQDTVELAIPGHSYTFGVVKEAQARGDFDVLAARGRRALRVHIGADVENGLASLRDALGRALS